MTEPRIDEIADGIYRISTLVPEAAPGGFTFNQFVIDAEEPLLFHTGPRAMFPVVSAAVDKLVGLDRLRWVAFGHVEADECGSMNEFLAAAPRAEVAHGILGCMVSLNDLCDRPPRMLAGDEVIDLGGRRVRHIDTPHAPHNWEARLLFEETTGTLLCGDFFTQMGDPAALVEDAPVEESIAAENAFHYTSNVAAFTSAMRSLAELQPVTLAAMHGASYRGDGAKALTVLAEAYEEQFRSEEQFLANRGGG
jgi:flavorubredoxin